MSDLCDHCGVNDKEYRRPTDGEDEGYCLECLRNHGADETTLIVVEEAA